MNRHWISIAIVAMLFAVAASAQPQRALPEYLQLTPDQITAWQQIQKDTAAAVQPLAANARDLQKQLQTALEAASPDPAAVGKLSIQLASVRHQIGAAHEAAKERRLAVLNAEQKTKFEAFQAAMEFLKQRRPGPHADRPPRH